MIANKGLFIRIKRYIPYRFKHKIKFLYQRVVFLSTFRQSIAPEIDIIHPNILVIFSPVNFDFEFMQRPQHLALHFQGSHCQVIFVELGRTYTSQKLIRDSGVLVISESAWLKLKFPDDWKSKEIFLFVPAHFDKISLGILREKDSEKFNIQVCADLYDLPHKSLNGSDFSRERQRLQEFFEESNDVLWIFVTDFLASIVDVTPERKLLLPNAAPTLKTISNFELDLDAAEFISEVSIRFRSMQFKQLAVFVGAFGAWIDQAELKRWIHLRQDWLFVIVGPSYLIERETIQRDNVITKASISYIGAMNLFRISSIGLLPFDNSGVSNAASPLKLYEYLHSGLFTISSNVEFANLPFVHFSGELEFEDSQIEKSREELNNEHVPDWNDRVKQFWNRTKN